ncbi:MAG: hypothetical protein BWX70_02469 [Verrucomicrobia bacterium ADurb.Bin070]|nr:MAG: hypothetical protein BWX70_02469 [Verrucomicrobia bacterium ADurb.Bin070]
MRKLRFDRFNLNRLLSDARRSHLAGDKPFPDQFIKAQRRRVQNASETFRRAGHLGRADRLMGLLRARTALVEVWCLRIIGSAIRLVDEGARGGLRIPRDIDRVGTHVGDQAHRRAASQLHALVEFLREAHGPVGREAAHARRRLLQRRGDERRQRTPRAFALAHRADAQGAAFEVIQQRLGGLLAADRRLLAVHAGEPHRERIERRLFAPHRCAHHPVRLDLKRLDLALALRNQTQRDRLHAPGAQPLLEAAPEHRAHHIAHDAVQHAARLLRIDALHVNGTRMLDRRPHGARRDLVILNAVYRLVLRAVRQRLLQMPRDRLTLAVRIGREVDLVTALCRLLQLGDHLGLAFRQHILRRKAMLDIHAQRALRQVTNVTDRRLHHKTRAQNLSDCLRLGRRLHDNQLLSHVHFLT